MKQFLLFIFSFLMIFGLNAQEISFDANPVIAEGTTSDWNVDGKFEASNNTSSEISFVWELVRTDVPTEWKFTICDDNLCYAPGFETCVGVGCDPNIFPVDYSTRAMKVTCQPNGTMYDGTVHLNLYDANDNSVQVASLEIQFFVTGSTSTFETVENTVNVYPNPTSDFFRIDSDQRYSQLSVHNILGKEVKSFDFQSDKAYDIKDLQSGLYLVRLFDIDGSSQQVIRLNKE